MPIPVVCPGCKAHFAVSEKFAGKKGPCPKCKTVILIPEAVKTEEVKIHVPEQFASAGKDTKGRPLSKPIARQEVRLSPVTIAAIVGGSLGVLVGALVARFAPPAARLPVIVVGLLAISPPLAIAGYFFLRDDELEPYRGRSLWMRAGICGLAYAALWGFYAAISGNLTGEVWQWFFVAPFFVSIGAAVAWGSLDLDFGSAALHYSFYLLMTILLRAVIGLPPLWNTTAPSVFG